MDTRFDLFGSELMMGFIRKFNGATEAAADSSLPTTVQNLVLIRASQINGCGMCTDMHTKDARAEGETDERMALVAAWREATVFTEQERAALALTEDGTRIADSATSIDDDVWQSARKHFDDEQLAALIIKIATINAWNRMNVIAGTPAGDYQPGQFG